MAKGKLLHLINVAALARLSNVVLCLRDCGESPFVSSDPVINRNQAKFLSAKSTSM
jgi:hypothetical protein